MRGINLIASMFTVFILLIILLGLCLRFGFDFSLVVSFAALILSVVTISMRGEDNEKNKKD